MPYFPGIRKKSPLCNSKGNSIITVHYRFVLGSRISSLTQASSLPSHFCMVDCAFFREHFTS
jgi:hypothetical protein